MAMMARIAVKLENGSYDGFTNNDKKLSITIHI